MRLKFNPEISTLLDLVRSELNPDQDLYLVGGAVRDALLGRELHDLDFVMAANPTALAKRLAKRLKAGFFVLDDERHTARIVYYNEAGHLFPLDFVQFTGDGLNADLKNRDFTINAMAVSVRDEQVLIDPLGGQEDLQNGVIRTCTHRSLLDDPVRVLRGIRLAIQFDLTFAQGLKDSLMEGALRLPQTSFERQRDEFFRILDGPDPASGIEHCRQCDVFQTLIPALPEQEGIPSSPPHVLPLFDHTIQVVANLDLFFKSLEKEGKGDETLPWWLVDVFTHLQPFSEQISTFLNEEVTPGRTKRGLILFGGLLHDIGKPRTMKTGEDDRLHYYQHDALGAEIAFETAKRLQLSNAESDWVHTMVRHHMQLLPLVNADSPPSRRSVYRFYKKTGDVGVAIALLSLADTLATYGTKISTTKWDSAVSITKILLSAWWEHQDTIVSPEPLLDGYDLQNEFGLQPGKQIGRLLDDLYEAQASGAVLTAEEARNFIRKQLEYRSH